MNNLIKLLDKLKTKNLKLPLEFDGTKSSEGKRRFMNKHKVSLTSDANGNGDDVFKATNVADSEEHGYNRPKGEDAKVYEAVSPWMLNQDPNLKNMLTRAQEIAQARHDAYGDPSKGTSVHVHKVGDKVTFLEPDPKSGKDHHTINNGHIVSIENGTASVKTSGKVFSKPLHVLVPVLSNMANFNQKNESVEYNLNKSMGLFAYINYYVESHNSVISDFSIKERIKLAFTDFFSETKDKQ